MTWGKIITTKFYLNTNLKPISVGHRKNLYPLYVRIICKQQVSQFKFFGKDLEPNLLSKEEFEEGFGVIDLSKSLNDLKEKSLGVSIATAFKKDVEYLLNFLDAFERDKFIIKNFPKVIKSFYQLDKDVLTLSSRSLILEMMKSGYESIVPIIDWSKQHPKGIESAILDMQNKFDLPTTKIDYTNLPFFHVKEVLELIKQHNALRDSKEKIINGLMSNMKTKTINLYGELLTVILNRSIDFYRESLKNTSR